jgi:hypothetical protein
LNNRVPPTSGRKDNVEVTQLDSPIGTSSSPSYAEMIKKKPLDIRKKSFLRDPQKEQGGNHIRKPEKKNWRGKKCKEANPPLKCLSKEIPEQGPPREVLPTPIPVNNAYSLLELQRLGESIEGSKQSKNF